MFARGKGGRAGPAKAGKAWQGLADFQKRYRIEGKISQPPEVRYQVRREQANPSSMRCARG